MFSLPRTLEDAKKLSIQQMYDKTMFVAISFIAVRNELRDLALAHSRIKAQLEDWHDPQRCHEPECPICGIILCPHDCPEHLWKDGCPCCSYSAVDPMPGYEGK